MRYLQYERVPTWGGTLFVSEDALGTYAHHGVMEVVRWCEEHFGPSLPNEAGCDPGFGPNEIPEGRRWGMNSLNDIWIERPDDAFAFKMRWS